MRALYTSLFLASSVFAAFSTPHYKEHRVTIGPYLGVQSRFDGNDLLVNLPSIHQDLRLLQFNEVQAKYFGLNYVHQLPKMRLSGQLEAQAEMHNKRGKYESDLDLTTAEVDVDVQITRNLSGLLALDYDNSVHPNAVGRRVSNSRLFLRNGFIAIGDLTRAPWYATVGQLYVPFGYYTSNALSSNYTKKLGRVHQRALVLGFAPDSGHHGFGELFVMRGDTKSGGAHRISEGGVNVDWHFEKPLHGDVSVSVISELAESDGMQSTGSSDFTGFGSSEAAEALSRRVPGVAAHLKIQEGPWAFSAEAVSAMHRYSNQDLAFNGQGARPSAWHGEVAYHSHWEVYPVDYSLAWEGTSQSLVIDLPKKGIIAAVNIAYWKDSIFTIEAKHEQYYPVTNSASGAGGATFNGPGGINNQLAARFAVYF